MTGMFDLVQNLYKSKGYEIDMEKSVYVGDAAGRLAGVGRRKDHGDTDYKLALNVGLKFVTPEVCLLSNYPFIVSNSITKIFQQVIKLWS
jgi:DNA 3'-phosphatase